MKPRITCIEDLDDTKIFPLIGVIRLGVKTRNPQGVEHPADLEYFRITSSSQVVVKKFHSIYGERPKSLRIACVSEELDEIFPNAYKWYVGAQLKCHGNARIAERRWIDVEPGIRKQLGGRHDPYDKVRIPCPCSRLGGACIMKGRFLFMLPEIHPAAAFALNTGSIINLREIRGTLRSYKDLFGRLSLVPLTLRREGRRIPFEGKSKVHHLLKLSYDGDWDSIQQIRASVGLPPLPCAFPVRGQKTAPPHTGSDALQPRSERRDAPGENETQAVPAVSEDAAEGATPSSPAATGAKAAALSIEPKPDASISRGNGTAVPAAPKQAAAPTALAIPLAQIRSVPAAPGVPPTNGTRAACPTEAPPSAADEKAHPPSTAVSSLPAAASNASSTAAAIPHPSNPAPVRQTAAAIAENAEITTSSPPADPKPQAQAAEARFPGSQPATGQLPAAPASTPSTGKQVSSPGTTHASLPSNLDSPPRSTAPRCACGTTVTDRVATYSRNKYGTILCMGCQKNRPLAIART
jgi:hypothetical protein